MTLAEWWAQFAAKLKPGPAPAPPPPKPPAPKAPPAPPPGALVITGPIPPAVAARLQQVASWAPAKVQALKTPVRGLTGAEWVGGRFLPREFASSTWYTGTSGWIYVRIPIASAYWVLHELGHAAYYRILTGAQHAEWGSFYLAHKGDMPSAYSARERPGEGAGMEAFAECFLCTFWQGALPPGYRPLAPHVRAKVMELLA